VSESTAGLATGAEVDVVGPAMGLATGLEVVGVVGLAGAEVDDVKPVQGLATGLGVGSQEE